MELADEKWHNLWERKIYVCYLGDKQIYEIERYKTLLPLLELRNIVKDYKCN